MKSMVKELYYGNISPFDRGFKKGGKYAKLLHILIQNEEILMNGFTPEQSKTYNKIMDCVYKMNGQNELEAFSSGFKLGVSLTAESLISFNAK